MEDTNDNPLDAPFPATVEEGVLRLLESGPMIKRTHTYCQPPVIYAIDCPKDKEHEITWSEFEGRIWCFQCQKDYNAGHWGIFDGPIPWETSKCLGICFDRIAIDGGARVSAEGLSDAFNATWVRTPELTAYEKMVDGIIYPAPTKKETGTNKEGGK